MKREPARQHRARRCRLAVSSAAAGSPVCPKEVTLKPPSTSKFRRRLMEGEDRRHMDDSRGRVGGEMAKALILTPGFRLQYRALRRAAPLSDAAPVYGAPRNRSHSPPCSDVFTRYVPPPPPSRPRPMWRHQPHPLQSGDRRRPAEQCRHHARPGRSIAAAFPRPAIPSPPRRPLTA